MYNGTAKDYHHYLLSPQHNQGQHLPHLDAALRVHTTPKPFVVYTGTTFSPQKYFDSGRFETHKHLRIHLPAYTSTSIAKHISADFAKPDEKEPYFVNSRTKEKVPVTSHDVSRIEGYIGSNHVAAQYIEKIKQHKVLMQRVEQHLRTNEPKFDPEIHEKIMDHFREHIKKGTSTWNYSTKAEPFVSQAYGLTHRTKLHSDYEELFNRVYHHAHDSEQLEKEKQYRDAVSANISNKIKNHLPDITTNLRHMIAIHVPTGAHGLYMPNHGSDAWAFEKEFLLPRDSKIKVSSKPIVSLSKTSLQGFHKNGSVIWPAKLVHDGTKELK